MTKPLIKDRLRVTGYGPVLSGVEGLLVAALSLSISGCQFPSITRSVPEPETRNPQSETSVLHPESGLHTRQISIVGNSGNRIEILAEIANEPEAQARGLMFREALPAGEGMLFIFPDESPRVFWMKNTLIPLDIIFFDASGDWVSGRTMIPCAEDPCPGYPSENSAKYALEVPAGSSEKWGAGEGWKLRMN